MNTWIIVGIIALALMVIIGNISLLRRSATPLRKQGLNDLKETLPRSNRNKDQVDKE